MIQRNAEIVIIDDTPDEVASLLKLLNRNGIGYCYYTGIDLEELPETPIEGIRILFLDFVLGTDGQSDKNKISALMGVIKRVVAETNGPYVIFAWTKHDKPEDDLLGLFKTEIMKAAAFPKPVVLIDLEKNDCLGKSFSSVSRKLMQKFRDKNILEILFGWEMNASLAIRDVVKLLTEISRPSVQEGQSFDDYSGKWSSELERHFCKISQMALGKKLKAEKKVLIAAQLALTQPFHDCVEKRIWNNTGTYTKLIENIVAHTSGNYTVDERALMNTQFLLLSHDLGKDLKPGNIYSLRNVYGQIKCKEKKCYLNKSRFGRKEVVDGFFCGELDTFGQKNRLLKEAIPVLMEITPDCDFVQNKWKHAKLVLGIFWPSEFERQLEGKAKYISSPVHISFNEKTYILVFNANYLLNFSFPPFKKIQPILAARKELLVDVQHWFSSHISRPGKVEF